MVRSITLKNWVIIVPAREAGNVDNLVRTMQNVAKPIGFVIQAETERCVPNNMVHRYLVAFLVQCNVELKGSYFFQQKIVH